MADFLVPGYGDKNRAFVQAILGRNTFTWGSAQTLIAAISSAHSGQEVPIDSINQEDLESYITLANRALSPLDLEIRSTLHQTSRNRVYALVNVASDPMTQLATTYSADEINFVKKMLDTMFNSNNRGRTEAMCISSIEVVQLSSKSTAKKLTGNEVEDLVRNLELEGWLEKSDAGFYALSPRALMELKGWLAETYNDVDEEDMDEEEAASRRKIKSCHACKEIITTGQRCARRECPFRLHDICIQNFFRTQRSQVCPLCQTAWDGKHYVGEKAFTTSDRYTGRNRNRATGGRPSAVRDNEAAQEEEDEESEGEA
ncbi:Non-structural maintenance of chromosomes element-like protein [Cyphellophora attinorum]|uniref:Non-structural maintenance of chromosomes element 1 homolog n=1 Tax=Cyphellophora attinorum TaxID=1664694 RepID=A0A0N1HEK9_9EURO|nr:Non-structural maintenance of chromosomes element-like protein [Phialophora attinorum]KPI43892.1 Non-structural maintenance of chromosomes element-like protein [Phialophora attinorum]